MRVNSGRQLCNMFFSLHVVFLSAANAELTGNSIHTPLGLSRAVQTRLFCKYMALLAPVGADWPALCSLFTLDCVSSRGEGYRGPQQTSSSGLTCLNWSSATRDYDANIHPDSHTGKRLHGGPANHPSSSCAAENAFVEMLMHCVTDWWSWTCFSAPFLCAGLERA